MIPSTFNGLALLYVIALVSVCFLAYSLWEWRLADRKRRLERMVHRNLQRAMGLGR
jgi:hypothetical protein